MPTAVSLRLLTAEKDALLRLATAAAKNTPAKPPMPLLSGVLIDADETGTTFRATDLETFWQVRTEAVTGDLGGPIVVPAKAFAANLKYLPVGKVTMEAPDADGRVVVKGGRNRFRLVTLPVQHFPPMPDVSGGECTLDGKTLMAALKQVLPAVAGDNEQRNEIKGVLWRASGGTLTLAATDSYRLHVKTLSVECGEAESIIPGSTLTRLPDEDGIWTITLGANQACITAGNTTIVTRLIPGPYPTYTALFPSAFTSTLRCNPKALKDALEAAGEVLPPAKPARIFLGDDLKIVGLSGTGEDVEQSEWGETAQYDGDQMMVGVNHRLLSEALDQITGDDALIEFTTPGKAMKVTSPADDTFVGLVMPTTIKG